MDELREELDAFDPHWRERYDTLEQAARAAGCLALFRRIGRRAVDDTPDYRAMARSHARALEQAVMRYGIDYGRDDDDAE